MKHLINLLLLVCLAGCAPTAPPDVQPPQSEFGPTRIAKVDRGFELVNRAVRVVIDEKTGDVTYWGTADGQRNLLLPMGVGAVLVRQPVAQPDGYVEKRDDQTWQYLGEAANGIGWRKIYCLETASVFVTYIVENRTKAPIDTGIAVRAHFKNPKPIVAQTDLYQAHVGDVTVRMQAFNEAPYVKPGGDTLAGDPRTLQPGERISLTMEWKMETLNAEPQR